MEELEARARIAALRAEGRLDEAAEALRAWLRRRPDDPAALADLAGVCEDLGRYREALEALDRGLAVAPRDPDLHNGLGGVLRAIGRPDEAAIAYGNALAAEPGFLDARVNRAEALLQAGRFQEGWREYDARLALRPAPLDLPLWDGRPLAGGRLLAWAEQGYGDSLMYVRYLAALPAHGAPAVLLCPSPLRRLLADLPGPEALLTPEEPPPSDLVAHCPLPSLPARLFAAEGFVPDPPGLPYLAPPQGLAPPPALAAGQGQGPEPGRDLRVGVVWAGGAAHPRDARRSLAGPEALAPLLATPGARFYSLQKGRPRTAEDPRLVALGPALADFADSAAALAALDLLVTVDTALAHLAGAMGRETWLLLADDADWRWGTGTDRTPWYPSMRLWRQAEPFAWAPVIRDLAAALRGRTAEGAPPPGP